jgi:hypothetical protein
MSNISAMLERDEQRRRPPPISLAGTRTTPPSPPSESPPFPPPPSPHLTRAPRVSARGKPIDGARDPQPGDEQVGAWPRDRLVSMDEKFRHALAAAIASGQERACDTVGAPCSPSTMPRLPAS